MKKRTPLGIEVVRGNGVESKHQVMVVVCEERGLVTDFWGNVDYLTFPRSAIKPIQALPFVESGALEKFGLDEKHLALACASHHGEPHHIEILRSWMQKIGLSEADLHCGASWPSHEDSAHALIKKNQTRSPIYHNCSGKHLGIISTCLALGEDFKDYHKIKHPAQVRLRRVLSDLMKVQIEKMPVGWDGCGIPTHAVPLQALAAGISSFINPNLPNSKRQTLQRVLQAWRYNPQLISGTQDFSQILSEKTGGRALLKAGAEGVWTGLMPEKSMAFALKVADGAKRAAEVAATAVFRHFGVISDAQFQDLKEWTQPSLKNSRGEEVGFIRVAAE